MNQSNNYILIREGNARLYVPNPQLYKRSDGVYEPAWAPVFYNPLMRLNRHISVAGLYAWSATRGRNSLLIVDALAGTGVRGIRYTLETGVVRTCIINDASKEAYNLARTNTRINNLNTCVVTRREANALLRALKEARRVIDFVDIDPYGSPSPFIDSAIAAVRRGGLVGLTATDIASLSGVKPSSGKRHYMATVTRNSVGREAAMRVLLGFVARVAAMRDRWIKPVISVSSRHFIRVIVEVLGGAKKASSMLDNCVGYVPLCGDILWSDDCKETSLFGPIWLCDIHDNEVLHLAIRFLRSIDYRDDEDSEEAIAVLEKASREVGLNKVFNLTSLARAAGVNTPRRDLVIECLRERGFSASATHYPGPFVRTNASYRDTLVCVKDLGLK
jgi:tRNA (guanine26-N2/guanine27-N2)-dimethyltransferase